MERFFFNVSSVAVLIPYLTTATPGGSETYNELNNIVKIGWSGGNGIYVINLPSAATIPYRVIRFVTNGTYPGGGSHKVRFTAAGTETISVESVHVTLPLASPTNICPAEDGRLDK